MAYKGQNHLTTKRAGRVLDVLQILGSGAIADVKISNKLPKNLLRNSVN